MVKLSPAAVSQHVELVTAFLMTATFTILIRRKNHEAAVSDTFLNPAVAAVPGLLFKAAAQLEMPKRLLTFESCFSNSA